jgi:hypothetical protein
MKKTLTIVLSLTLALGIIISSQASPSAWRTFITASTHWTQSLTGLFTNSELARSVSAQGIQDELANWQNWPSSQKLKDFDGGWNLPFEAFTQQYNRGWQNRNQIPQYYDKALEIDLNGDGLQDLLYSKGDVTLHGQSQNFVWFGLTQYIILRRANGFELAYKCYQRPKSVYISPAIQQQTQWWYYGDCADTSYTSTNAGQEKVWNPATVWNQKRPQMTQGNTLDRASYMGLDGQVFEFLNIDLNINGSQAETFPRYMPKFTDINGDGLPDVVFFGSAVIGEGNSGPYTFQNIQFVLYNNGRGFDIEAGCVTTVYGYECL